MNDQVTAQQVFDLTMTFMWPNFKVQITQGDLTQIFPTIPNPIANLDFLMKIQNCPNVPTTPIMAMGCKQCLPLSIVQLKGKHYRKPHCRNGVVDMFRHCHVCQIIGKIV